MGDLAASQQLFLEALKIDESTLGADDADVKAIRSRLEEISKKKSAK